MADFNLINWNVNPNRDWYVKLSDAGTGVLVELFLTQASLQAGTSRQAYGTSSGYGSAVNVTLTVDSGATVSVSLYQDRLTWHVQVLGAAGYSTTSFLVKKFFEKQEIQHAAYVNGSLADSRALGEINYSTNIRKIYSLSLAQFVDMSLGDVVAFDSDRIAAEKGQVEAFNLELGISSIIITGVRVVNYIPMKRS